ncbi:MAG: FdtA/QdtA family cupin domain-containing protein [Gemmatimonadota bacterium]|nr:FdtA/QdtA family cupin domain-containing protein [Gemmatimonadota bacterium]
MLAAARLVELPERHDDRGSLTFIEGGQHLPFSIRRVYYLHGTTPGARRGGHAHRELQQLFVAVAGTFDIELSDGDDARHFTLARPSVGLYVPQMLWRELDAFSTDAVCLVLASEHYGEADYFRDYDDFRNAMLAPHATVKEAE